MKIFNQVAIRRPKKSKFDLSHERKLTAKWGELTPVLVKEILPGESINLSTEMLIRLAPMKFPVMHMINAYIHYFYVPNRLVWDDWENFITGGEDGLSNPVFPYIPSSIDNSHKFVGSIWDNFGLPIPSTSSGNTDNTGTKINALIFRAYAAIWNDYYRSQDLQDKIVFSKASGMLSGADQVELTKTRYRSWERDYFTSALPEAQKGGEVLLPMEADVVYRDTATIRNNQSSNEYEPAGEVRIIPTAGTPEGRLYGRTTVSTDAPFGIENIEAIENASTTINELRNAVRLQEWLEKNARAGSRYVESLLAHFGKRSSDARLQRPEYLGGVKQAIRVSEVLQTYEGTDPLGKLGGHGISVGKGGRIRREFEEHGYLFALMSIVPKTSYFQGMPKMFLKETKFDFAFPEFAQLGEQAILNKEVYYNETEGPTVPNETFGYIPRYSEYKYINSHVSGQFRSTLKSWHLGREFATRPALNGEFLDSSKARNDIFNVNNQNEDKFFIQLFHNMQSIMPLPYFGTPTL